MLNIKLTRGQLKQATNAPDFEHELSTTLDLLRKIIESSSAIFSRYTDIRARADVLLAARDYGAEFLLLIKILNDQDFSIPQFDIQIFHDEKDFETQLQFEIATEIIMSNHENPSHSRAMVINTTKTDVIGVIQNCDFPKLIEISKSPGEHLYFEEVFEFRQVYLGSDEYNIRSRCTIIGKSQKPGLVSVYWLDTGHDSALCLSNITKSADRFLMKSASCITWIVRPESLENINQFDAITLADITQVPFEEMDNYTVGDFLTGYHLIYTATVELLAQYTPGDPPPYDAAIREMTDVPKPPPIQEPPLKKREYRVTLVFPADGYTPRCFIVQLPKGDQIKIELDLRSSQTYGVWDDNVMKNFGEFIRHEPFKLYLHNRQNNGIYMAECKIIRDWLHERKLLHVDGNTEESESSEDDENVLKLKKPNIPLPDRNDRKDGPRGWPDKNAEEDDFEPFSDSSIQMLVQGLNKIQCTGVINSVRDGKLTLTLVGSNAKTRAYLDDFERTILKRFYDRKCSRSTKVTIKRTKGSDGEFIYQRVEFVNSPSDRRRFL